MEANIRIKGLPLDCQRAVMHDFIGETVKPLVKLKRDISCWLSGFAGKKYTITAIDIMTESKEPVFVLKTGYQDYDYQLCYFDEVDFL